MKLCDYLVKCKMAAIVSTTILVFPVHILASHYVKPMAAVFATRVAITLVHAATLYWVLNRIESLGRRSHDPSSTS